MARRAGGQVVAGSAGSQAVTNVVCCRFTFGYRSVSLCGTANSNFSVYWVSIYTFYNTKGPIKLSEPNPARFFDRSGTRGSAVQASFALRRMQAR